MIRKPGVLFVCTHNSARSQMAEGWLRQLAGDRFEVASAGVAPGALHPLAVRAMSDVGIDISTHRAESIDAYLGRWPIDQLITVCDKASRSCPSVPSGVCERQSWSFEDPSAARGSEEQRLAVFRRVRDEIRQHIEQWIASMPVPTRADGPSDGEADR